MQFSMQSHEVRQWKANLLRHWGVKQHLGQQCFVDFSTLQLRRMSRKCDFGEADEGEAEFKHQLSSLTSVQALQVSFFI